MTTTFRSLAIAAVLGSLVAFAQDAGVEPIATSPVVSPEAVAPAVAPTVAPDASATAAPTPVEPVSAQPEKHYSCWKHAESKPPPHSPRNTGDKPPASSPC